MLVAYFRHKDICQLLISFKILQFNKHIRDQLEIMDFSESELLNLRAYNKSNHILRLCDPGLNCHYVISRMVQICRYLQEHSSEQNATFW
jgi:hypothetical protein